MDPLEHLSRKLEPLESSKSEYLKPEILKPETSKPETSKPYGPLENSAERTERIRSSASGSIEELHGLVSELQKLQEFLKSGVDSVQRQIDSALSGINIIVETIGPWKSIVKNDADRRYETPAKPEIPEFLQRFPKQ